MVEQNGFPDVRHWVRRGLGQRMAVSVPVLQERRR